MNTGNDNEFNFLDDVPFEFKKKKGDDDLRKQSWKEISDSMIGRPGKSGLYKKAGMLGALGICCFLVLFFLKARMQGKIRELTVVETDSNKKQLTLPDGSVIMLNKNTRVSANINNWSDNKREVWLTGEAFFEIKKVKKEDKSYSNFIVHTAKGDIEVLGTTFNVEADSAGFCASLNTGRIKALIDKDEVVSLLPGQMVIVRGNDIIKKKIDVQLYSAWKDGEFHFNNTLLGEIIPLIKKYYQVKVVVADGLPLWKKRLSGDIAVKDSTGLFNALHVIMGLNIKQTKDSLIISE